MTNCAWVTCYTADMEIIYIDSLFFLSLLTDYLLCLISAGICGLYLKRWRYFAAALLGAAYSVSVFLPGLSFLAAPAVKLAAALAMGMTAFGAEAHPLRCTGVFLAVSATFGGSLWALGLSYGRMDAGVLIVCFLLCYLALTLLSRFRAKLSDKKRVQVELSFMGKSCRFFALVDTGNCLRDPLTGARVMIVSPTALSDLFGALAPLLELPDAIELMECAAALPELRGRLRLIPYSAVGAQGLLPLFRPDSLSVDGQAKKETLVAISKAAEGSGFQAIISNSIR